MYEDMALKFAEHFVFIAAAMDRIATTRHCGTSRTGSSTTCSASPTGGGALKVRSMVGLLPLCASMVLPVEGMQASEELLRRSAGASSDARAARHIHDPPTPGVNGRRMLAVLDEDKLRRVLVRMLDEDEFLGPHGLPRCPGPRRASLHVRRPRAGYEVRYLPGESDSGMFGGNSNWRGPVWFPVNYLILRGLLHLYAYYGDGSPSSVPPDRAAVHAVRGCRGAGPPAGVDLRAGRGRPPADVRRHRAVPGRSALEGPLVFNEYFHGDNGAGLGASHQTGWTGLVARIIQVLGYLKPEDLLSSALKGHLVYGAAAPR